MKRSRSSTVRAMPGWSMLSGTVSSPALSDSFRTTVCVLREPALGDLVEDLGHHRDLDEARRREALVGVDGDHLARVEVLRVDPHLAVEGPNFRLELSSRPRPGRAPGWLRPRASGSGGRAEERAASGLRDLVHERAARVEGHVEDAGAIHVRNPVDRHARAARRRQGRHDGPDGRGIGDRAPRSRRARRCRRSGATAEATAAPTMAPPIAAPATAAPE